MYMTFVSLIHDTDILVYIHTQCKMITTFREKAFTRLCFTCKFKYRSYKEFKSAMAIYCHLMAEPNPHWMFSVQLLEVKEVLESFMEVKVTYCMLIYSVTAHFQMIYCRLYFYCSCINMYNMYII